MRLAQVFLGGILTLFLTIMFLFWQAGDRVSSGLEMMFNAPTPTPQVEVRSVVLEQVRTMSELNTVNQRYSAIIPVVQEGAVLMVVPTQTKLLYVAVGDVQAGIDLSQLTKENVQVVGETVHITLPPPQITGVSLDPTDSQVYGYDRGFLNLGPESPHLQSEAERRGEAELLFYACRSGIMEDANQQATTVLQSLLSMTTERPVLIETQPPQPGSCPTGEPSR